MVWVAAVSSSHRPGSVGVGRWVKERDVVAEILDNINNFRMTDRPTDKVITYWIHFGKGNLHKQNQVSNLIAAEKIKFPHSSRGSWLDGQTN